MKRLKRTLKYQGSIIPVYADTIELDNGKIVEWDYIDHIGAAAVVPVLDDGRILVVRQYRNTVDRVTLELPAGKKDVKGEPGIECASRELEEETGHASDSLEWLVNICSWVAFSNEIIEVFVATDLKKTKQNLDEDEFVDVESYTLEELKEKIFSGEIEDAKTISGLLAYEAKYLNKK
ncbi:MAG: NUDIX hydrolase [Eubacteriales bacterium]